MKKKSTIISFKNLMLVLCLQLLLFSCGSKSDIVYFQNIDQIGSSKSITNYNPIIKPDDMLTIVVSALDQDLARPFNLAAMSFVGLDGRINQTAQQSYLVGSDGNIEFPVLGTLKLSGLNKIQATSLLKDMLKDYIKNPIVNIRTVNFKVTILGEVNRPGTFTINNERLTILEALGLAGDMGLQAERRNVLVVREQDRKKTFTRIDLTTGEMFNSPVYYLAQNDVIYVEPNSSKVRSSSVGPSTSATLSVLSILVTAAAVAVSITR